jgi:predicted acylesterase/phospholipase RssA
MLPKRLVFAGGGTRCLVFLSALKELEAKGHLVHVTEWWGTSAGSLLAALLALTQSVEKVRDIMQQTRYDMFRDISLLNLVNFTSAWGLDDGHSMVTEIERILDLAVESGSQKTMGDVLGLRIVVADLNVYETVVCSAATFPRLRIVDAIRASMSLPVLYRPFQAPNGNIWVDGGLRAGFPWDCLTAKERQEAIGFAFERSWMQGPRTFSEYMFSMLHFEDPKQITRYKKEWPFHILWFPSPPFPAWYMRLQEDDYAMLEIMGIKVVQDWFRRVQHPSRTPQIPPLSEDRCTPLQETPGHHTNGRSDIPPPSPLPSQAPFQDPLPHRILGRRRWSL